MRHWEDLCNHCGLCCHEKVVLDYALVIDMDRPCEFFDEKSHLCSVYDNRFRKCKRCKKVNIIMAVFSPALPSCCAYVKEMERLHLRLSRKRELVFSNLD